MTSNYAEELVYWYLRLNGFFPLTNFVQHRDGNLDSSSSKDRDIIAIRFPHVREKVGGSDIDWDTEHLFNVNRDDGKVDRGKIIGIIGEVKGGAASTDISQLNNKEHLQYSLERIGFFPSNTNEQIVTKLHEKNSYEEDKYQVVKIFFSRNEKVDPSIISITLPQINKFIIERMEKYRGPKNNAWVFFNSNLLQYLIFRANNPPNQESNANNPPAD